MAAIHSDFTLDNLITRPDSTPSSGNPRDNEFLENNRTPFKADFADIEVGAGALRTVIVARQSSLKDVGVRLESDGPLASVRAAGVAVAAVAQGAVAFESARPLPELFPT